MDAARGLSHPLWQVSPRNVVHQSNSTPVLLANHTQVTAFRVSNRFLNSGRGYIAQTDRPNKN